MSMNSALDVVLGYSLEITAIILGAFGISILLRIMRASENGDGKVGKDLETRELFTCPEGHTFTYDEGIKYWDNLRERFVIYCPACWKLGKKVEVFSKPLELKHTMKRGVVDLAPTDYKPPEKPGSDVDYGKVMSEVVNVLQKIMDKIESIESKLNELDSRVGRIEHEKRANEVLAVETVDEVLNSEEGEVEEEEVVETYTPSKRRGRKKK